MVHFQITRNCNLRCSFCGQWGKKGFFSDANGDGMELCDWKKVTDELVEYREENDARIDITVWGGEPLVSPYFDELVEFLHNRDFRVSIITNGVFIDRHIDAIKKYVSKVYVSIDGPRELHDEIRGKGVFDKVSENIRLLGHENVTVMTVITKKLICQLFEYLKVLDTLDIKALYLQDMIGLEKEEIKEYKSWLKNAFNIDAIDISSWENDSLHNFGSEIDAFLAAQDLSEFSYKITHKTHFEDERASCLSPFKHIHIAWNGNLLYCTDFYDFSAGNVKKENVIDIFNNSISEKFRDEIRKNNCKTCRHCSWRNNKSFYIEEN